MKAPLALTLVLTDQTVESTGWMLQWSASTMPAMWDGKVEASGAVLLPRPLARLVSEVMFGLIWEAHKPTQVGQLSAGLELMSTHAVPSGRSQ